MVEIMIQNPALEAVGWALIQFVWQGTLVAVLVALALAFLSRRDPRLRYGFALVGLAIMFVLPFGTALDAYQGREPLSAGTADETEWLGAPPAVVSVEGASASPGGVLTALPDGAQVPGRGGALVWTGIEAWLPGVVLAWFVGVAALSLRMIGGWFLVRRLRRRAVSGRAELTSLVRRTARRMNLKRTVGILESAIVGVPTAVGWLRPVILLPASAATGLSPEQLEAVIAHELAHIRRHDYVVNLFQTAVETLLFYHPGVWWLSRRIRIEREQVADDLAVAVCGDAVLYAETLCELDSQRSELGLVLTATGGSLIDRVRRVLGQPVSPARRSPAWLATLAGSALVLVLALTGADRTAVATPATSETLTGREPALAVERIRAVPLTTEEVIRSQAAAGSVEGAERQDAEDRSLVAEQVPPPPRQVGPQPPQPPRQVVPQPPQPPRQVVPQPPQAPRQAVPQPPQPPRPPAPFAYSGQVRVLGSAQRSGWMGVTIEDGADRGVLVNSVEAASPASNAGIETGDLITAFNGTNVLGTIQFTRLVSETPAGRTVPLAVVRDGQEREVEVTLSRPPNPLVGLEDRLESVYDKLDVFDGNYLGLVGGSTLGLRVDTMTPELREFFGAAPNAGVLVVSMENDSVAAAAGVRVGDVIVAVDGNRVDSPNRVRNLARAVLSSGNAVTLTVIRDRSERDVVVEPPADPAQTN